MDEIDFIESDDLFRLLIFLVILCITFLLIYYPHLEYRFPLHIDEWQHVARATNIIENGWLKPTHPYFAEPRVKVYLEPGFHIFLSELSLLTGLNLVTSYGFLAALFGCISAFVVFTLVSRITGSFYAGIFSMLFLASLKSNINILGLWFFIPLTLSIPLIYLFFTYITRWVEGGKNEFGIVSCLVLFTIVTVHPSSFTFMIPALVFYFLIRAKKVIRNIRGMMYFLVIPLLGFFIFMDFIWRGSMTETYSSLISELVFEHGWGVTEVEYSVPEFYGLIPVILAFAGLLPLIRKRKWLMILWPLTTAPLLYVFVNYGFSIFAPYQRMLYYTLLGFAPLSAIGLNSVINLIRKTLTRFVRNSFVISLTGILILAVFVNTFVGYTEKPSNLPIYHAIEEQDYRAIMWLGQQHGPHNTVIADRWISTAIYPISRNHVLSVVPAQLEEGDRKTVDEFFDGDCDKKKEIIENNKIDFVLNRKRINCAFLNEIYNEGDYIYAPTI